MKNILKLVAAAAVAVALTQSAHAVPIVGTIGFSGGANADGTTAATSTQAFAWNNTQIVQETGVFASLSSAASVILHAPWTFNGGAINSFWVVTDGANNFTFNLASSAVSDANVNSLTVVLAGTVLSNIAGFSPTAFTGSFTLQNPGGLLPNGQYRYSSSLSFGSVPDGGTTVLLLGSALSGLALIRRKLAA